MAKRKTSKRGAKKTTKKASQRKGTVKKKRVSGKDSGTGADLRQIPMRELTRELKKRARQLGVLVKRRDMLAAEMEGIEAQIRELQSSGMRPSQGNLADLLVQLLGDREMSPQDLAKAALQAGYFSVAKNLRINVAQVMRKDDRFVNVRHGVYALRDRAYMMNKE